MESGFAKSFGQVVFTKLKILSDTNLVASMYNKKEKASLPVDVRLSKTSLLKGTGSR